MLLLADAIVVLHLAFIAFATVGGFLLWRWPRMIFAHLPALAWATWIAVTGSLCPLTPLENRLREIAGEGGYQGGFIEHYILPMLYPVGLTRETQWLLAAVLLAFNVVAYHGFIVRVRRGAKHSAT
ncbi:MAG TPA: DUF2784 domain-containing protein [Steroidobacteraceae bacterium]|nr:DUF2784 domain-containing protein [Steroidobacteraceae bacterium]